MKIFLFLFVLSASLPTFAQHKNDSLQIVELLKADYKTMVNFDITKHRGYCTPDYLLIENGEIWDMNREAAYYDQRKHVILDRKDQFSFRLIRIEGNTAYAVYHLRSDITENGKPLVRNWNESVVFRKVNGAWKIALIHSSPVPVNPTSN